MILLVVRELALDQARDDLRLRHFEQHLVLVRRRGDVDRALLVADHARQLAERLRRHDHQQRLGVRLRQLHAAHGQAEAVGGGERELPILEGDQHAGEDRAALVGGGGEGHGLDALLEHGRRQRVQRRVGDGRDGREVLGVDALDVGGEAAAGEVHGVAARRERHVDAVVRQRGDEVDEQAGG